jgi:hypothetical protein
MADTNAVTEAPKEPEAPKSTNSRVDETPLADVCACNAASVPHLHTKNGIENVVGE